MKTLLALIIATSFLIMSCEDTSDDPITPPVVKVVDSVTITTLDDTLTVFALKENSTALRGQTVYLGRPLRKTAYDVSFTATGVTRGKIYVKYVYGPGTEWKHTFTTDPSTWTVSTSLTGELTYASVSSDTATGTLVGRTVGR